MSSRSENIIVASLTVTFLVAFTVILLRTDNSFGGADHFNHYNLARWGWKYPDLLFSHWGKPVFTIVISPFAQLGMDAARFYNVLTGISTAVLTWLLAMRFTFRPAWAVLPLVLFMPVYFALMFTALTEVTFSFFLVLSLHLFFRERFAWSAVVLSFLPLIRNEGVVLLPLFVAAYMLKGRAGAIPLLCVGAALIGVLGWRIYGDPYWLVTHMPYTGDAVDIYGRGSLMHFVGNTHRITGIPLGLIFLLGALAMTVTWVRRDRCGLSDAFYFLLLIVGSFVVFLAAHSVAWWLGVGNSLGLLRVMGSVTPLAALTGMAGISLLFRYREPRWTAAALVLLACFIAWNSYRSTQVYEYGFRKSWEQAALDESIEYLIEQGLDENIIYYYNPYVAFRFDFDPEDRGRSRSLLFRRDELTSIPAGSVIFWDAHFGPNEGRTPLSELQDRPDLKTVAVFEPEVPFTVFGHDYKIIIFKK